MRQQSFRLLVAMMLAFVLSGCSAFHRDYEKLAAEPPSANDITGAWIGSWQNTSNTHGGALRAIVTHAGENIYHARFYAIYGSLLTFESEVDLAAVQEGDAVQFTGSKDLGFFAGGVFTYKGRATSTEFVSEYDSKYDTGTYTLKRPAPPTEISP